jgi:hypothetical protein
VLHGSKPDFAVALHLPLSWCIAVQFKEYFEKYGVVLEAQIMVDHTSMRSRGFG